MSFPDVDRNRRDLDPWRVILACLFDNDIDSHDIPGIIDASGLIVDWALSKEQNFSHKFRKAAYRPRINKAYETLSEGDKLRVTFIVCDELTRRGLRDKVDTGLQRIGWRINGSTLVPANESVRELFLPSGTQHDAYVHIRDIIRSAKRSLRIIDPYLDGTVFTILGNVHRLLTVELLTAKLPTDFSLEAKNFQKQYPKARIEIRRSGDFHDRFIVIDEKTCWHLGCSIKDAGTKAFMVNAIEDRHNVEALLETLRKTWARATQIV